MDYTLLPPTEIPLVTPEPKGPVPPFVMYLYNPTVQVGGALVCQLQIIHPLPDGRTDAVVRHDRRFAVTPHIQLPRDNAKLLDMFTDAIHYAEERSTPMLTALGVMAFYTRDFIRRHLQEHGPDFGVKQ